MSKSQPDIAYRGVDDDDDDDGSLAYSHYDKIPLWWECVIYHDEGGDDE